MILVLRMVSYFVVEPDDVPMNSDETMGVPSVSKVVGLALVAPHCLVVWV